jgi:uncharacterized protein involved in response to NO
MATLIRIEEPQLRPAPVKASWDAFVSMAFRPFYLLAAIQGVVAILAWRNPWSTVGQELRFRN